MTDMSHVPLSAEGRDISCLTLDHIPDSLSQTLKLDSIEAEKQAVALDVTDADSLNSFTTVNEDGSRSIYSFTQPVKYWNSDTNRIEFIDTDWQTSGWVDSLFSGKAYTNKADDVKVSLPGNLNSGVSLEWSGRAMASQEMCSSEPMAVSPTGQSKPATGTAVAARDYTFRMTPAGGVSARPAREEGSPFVCYEGAFGEGTRLEYKAVQGGIKENLVLESNPGVNEFSFTVDAPGLVPDVMQGGTIVFYDEQTDSPAVTLTQPWAMDSRAAQNAQKEADTLPSVEEAALEEASLPPAPQDAAAQPAAAEAHPEATGDGLCLQLSYRVEPAGEGKYRLTMVVDREFLNSPSTVYPVTIDPSVFTYASRIPFITLFSDGTRLNTLGAVGYASGIDALMYFKMPDMNTYKYINPNRVISASVVMTQEVASEERYEVDLHDSNTGVSIADATYSTVLQGTGTRMTTTYCGVNSKRYVWDFKALFRAWLGYELQGEGWGNYQFIIKARSTDRPRKYFDTSEDSAFYYVITYNEETMIEDGYYYIRSARDGKYLDHHMSENRTNAWTFDGTPNQRWKVTRHSGNTYSIKPADDPWLALEVYQGLDVNNRPITQYLYDSTMYYQWRIISNNDGTFRMMPCISKTKGIDVYHGANTTMTFNGRSFPKRYGIDVQLFEYNGNTNQNWIFVNTSHTVTGVRMSDIAGTSTLFFNIITNLGNNLGGLPCAKLVDSSATDVWNLMQSSGIFIVNGHGQKESLGCGGGTELTKEYVKAQPAGSLNNCRLVIYRSCLTALGGNDEHADNLAKATQERGAKTVIGFQESILTNQANTWLEGFCNAIAAGQSVEQAKDEALNHVKEAHGSTNTGYTDSAVVFGAANQTFK